LEALKTAEAEKPATERSSVQKPATSHIYKCYGKRKDPLSWVLGDYAYKPKAKQETVHNFNDKLGNILRDTENLVFRRLKYLFSSTYLTQLQDTYQIPTAFDRKERCNKATAFALVYNFWSAIHIDDDFYYSSLYCISEDEDDKSLLFYFCFLTYGVAFPMYSGSVMCFSPLIPHGTRDPTKKDIRIFSDYVSAKICNTPVAYIHSSGFPA
jgi:hypothetical protein